MLIHIYYISYQINENEFKFGGNLTLANLIKLLDEASNIKGYEYGKVVADHIRKVATTPLRNVRIPNILTG